MGELAKGPAGSVASSGWQHGLFAGLPQIVTILGIGSATVHRALALTFGLGGAALGHQLHSFILARKAYTYADLPTGKLLWLGCDEFMIHTTTTSPHTRTVPPPHVKVERRPAAAAYT